MNNAVFDAQVKIGRKVFFINPNLTLFPESFCEGFLANGFECYFIMKDTAIFLETKLDILINSFEDPVLIFYIDSPDPKPGVSWIQFMKDLNRKYGNSLGLGVMYTKRPSKYDNEQLSFLYQNEARASCGAYTLEFDKNKNFASVMQGLVDIETRGRRKHVRVLCRTNCVITFNLLGRDYFLNMTDLSLSHFTCIFEKASFNLEPEDMLREIEFNIRGIHFKHDAKLLFLRPIRDEKILCVFAFIDRRGQPGLDSNVYDMLLPKLYSIMSENFNVLFKKIYEEFQLKLARNAEEGESMPPLTR